MARKKSAKIGLWQRMDYVLFVISIIAAILGLISIYSATLSTPDTYRYIIVQSVAVILGIACFILISMIDYEILGEFPKFIYGVSTALLVLVLIIGVGAKSTGTQGWIRFGPIGIQPAEFVKIGFIITFAKHLEKTGEDVNYLVKLFALLMHVLVFIGLILLQPDAGSAMVFAFIFISMLFMAGLNYKYLGIGGLVLVVMVGLIWIFKDYLMAPHQIDRILVFFDPYRDPTDTGYNIIQSEIAVGSGQLFGKGYLKGTQNQLEYLPTKYTDFIFSTIAEEWGFIGALVVLVILITLIFRCIYIANTARTEFGSYVCIGVAALLLFHTFENIGMCIRLMPVTGIPLPFFSYGGSSVITNFIALGLVNSIKMRRRSMNF